LGFLRHSEAVLGDVSELGDTPKVHLSSVLQGYDNVTPLSDEAWHHLHVLYHAVPEVAAVLTRQPRDHRHPQVAEPVPQVHGA